MAYISVEEVKNIRNKLKVEFPKFKFSVSGGGSSSLYVSILQGPVDFGNFNQVNQHHLYQYGKFEKLFTKMIDVMKGQKWFDKSDFMTDYFHIAYYLNLSVGKWNKPYVQVK